MSVAEQEQAGPEAVYFSKLESGIFEIQRCDDCNGAVFYPRLVCPHCGSAALSWFAPTGRGTVYATTTVHTGGEPYNVCLVDLDEGARMMTRVEDMPPGDVGIGLRVQARIQQADGGARIVFDALKETP